MGRSRAVAHGLTERQIQVVEGLSDGKSAIEIAEEMGVSKGTIDWHRSIIYAHLGITDIVDLTKWALANGYAHNQYARGRPRKPKGTRTND